MIGPNRSIDRIDDMSAIALTRELTEQAVSLDPDGMMTDEVKQHIVDFANHHLITSGEPRKILTLADSVLYLTDSSADIAFMSDEHVADTISDETTIARGYLYEISYLASVAFSGFGLRMYGVDIVSPTKSHQPTVFVPVDDVRVTIAA